VRRGRKRTCPELQARGNKVTLEAAAEPNPCTTTGPIQPGRTLRSAFTSHHRTSVSGRGLLTWNRVIGKYECKHACNCEGEATRDPFR